MILHIHQLNLIRSKYLQFWDHHRGPFLPHPWRSSGLGIHWHRICCIRCCWLCSPPKGKENHSLSEAVQSAECRKPAKVDKVKWTALCNTLARETMLFRRVAAASYSGASRLQWPHLMDRRDRSGKQVTLMLYLCFLSAKTLRDSVRNWKLQIIQHLIQYTLCFEMCG